VNHIKKRGGFTLVEIMIVVLIIGILMSIAAPNYVQARNNSRKAICIGNLKQIDSSKEQFAMDTKLDSGATVNWSDLAPTYMKPQPTCPSGGTYTIAVVGTNPTCSIAGHVYMP
jgi:prepilin-type N-terminal cleavage/methylation domain-containing protein